MKPALSVHIRQRLAAVALACAPLLPLLFVPPPPLAAQQRIGYSLDPTASLVRWDDALPLEDRWMAGARLSLLFGPRVELQPFYLRGSRLAVDSARGADVFGPAALRRTLRVDHMGATVQYNLGTGSMVPFVRAGGGVLKFDPDSGDVTRRVTVLAAGGLRFDLGGVHGEVFAEQFRMRLAPERLFGGTAADSSAALSALRQNAYGASLSIPLSAFDDGGEPARMRSVRAPIEPFVGRLRYDSDAGLDDQDLAGVRAGVEVGDLLGLRGFYWRGVNEDRDGTAPVSGYGGEAQFNFSGASGIAPFVVAGAGRIDFDRDFRDPAGLPRADETALIVGGGLSLRLGDRLRANVAVRDYITTAEGVLNQSRDPGDLRHNRLVSAGFTLAIGSGSSRDATVSSVRTPRRGRAMAATAARGDREERVDSAVVRDDVREAREAREARATQPRELRTMRDARATDSAMRVVEIDTVIRVPEASVGGRPIVVPAPTVGEIIIRYGPPAMAAARPMMPGAVGDTARVTVVTPPDTVRVAVRTGGGDESRIYQERIAALERQLDELRRENDRVRTETPTVEVFQIPDSSGTRAISTRRSFGSRLMQARPNDLLPFAGGQAGDGSQFVVGLRANLGPLNPDSRFDLVPELAVGRGNDRTTLLALANLRYSIGTLGRVTPYAMLGGGAYTRTVLAIGTSVGASINLKDAGQTPVYLYTELQGLNLFDHARVLLGLSKTR